MRALLATSLLVLVLGIGSAAAGAAALPESPVGVPGGPVVLPSAEVPNQPGSVLLPPGVWEAPFFPAPALSYDELQALWVRAGAAYAIPWQVLAAINQIESNFGRNMGPSSAGAVGWMQFIPDTWLRWGMDGNGDGIADPWNPEDAVHSAARYLAAANGRTDIERAIFAYNHAQWYVDDVLELAAVFGGGAGATELGGIGVIGVTGFAGADVVFTLDRMAIALEEAQERVASLSELLVAAEEVDARLSAEAAELARAADDPTLLVSDNVVAEQEAFQAEQVRAAAAAEVERLRAELTEAEAVLEAAESGALAASFTPAAASMLRMPTRADGYVFPVGGGPSIVSVGHDHHDYPAADIAAPLGTPLYALAAGTVLSLSDSGNCGIGIVFQTVDGLEWVYCHLSYRDPGLMPGSPLLAGQWVGLVGSTGNSTGPHLHLGLRPARFPQEMPWFEEFAGIAFTWQDAVTEPPSQAARVFQVVPTEEPGDVVVEFTLGA